MRDIEKVKIVEELAALVAERYVFAEVAARVAGVLRAAAGSYPRDERGLAEAVTADLQSVNGDKHLRLLHHVEPLAERQPGDDAEEYAAMTRWAARTGDGVARVERLPGNVGRLELQPLLFPAVISGDAMVAALGLVASADALIIDLRRCIGGEPAMEALICSYLWTHEPVELTGLFERSTDRLRQSWTLAHVTGRRFGATKPVYVLIGPTTFSGGEALAYDLQQLGRATVVGERTRGGAHAREGFRLHPHLEATISVARSVNPVSGGNWEGTGVVPDVEVDAARAWDAAYRSALERVDTPPAREALASLAAVG
jgi:hypothetical protein